MVKILIACEESQTVCKEMRRLGHEAYSCDIIECSGGYPEWHIMQDVVPLLNGNCRFKTMDGVEHEINGRWDMIIAHPPCTYLSKAGGNRLRINGEIQLDRYGKGIAAKEFFMSLYSADCQRIAVENPIPLKLFGLPSYSQIIQPFMFGDPWYKTTCLWLKGLPLLMATDLVQPIGKWVNCTDHRKIKAPDNWAKSGTRNARERSKTFPGIARAMAEQWAGQA